MMSNYGNYNNGESTGEHRLVFGFEIIIHEIDAYRNNRVSDKRELLQMFLETCQVWMQTSDQS